MPPVFGPWSLSKTRLWSCDEASGRMCSPSGSKIKLASSPSSGEAVGLDHIRRLELAQIFFCRRRVGERRERRGRDFILAQHLFRERLAAFEPRGLASRRENFKAPLLEELGDSERERQLGTDHRQIDAVFLRERGELLDVVDRDRHELGALADAVAARRDEYFLDARALPQLPNERVLAPAAADDEDFHTTKSGEGYMSRLAAHVTRCQSRARRCGTRSGFPLDCFSFAHEGSIRQRALRAERPRRRGNSDSTSRGSARRTRQ